MSECKWTDGEWWVADRSTNGVKGYEICWSEHGECVTDHVYEKADAHLMAASKELYEALLLAMQSIDPENFDDFRVCNAAIAKARGESQ